MLPVFSEEDYHHEARDCQLLYQDLREESHCCSYLCSEAQAYCARCYELKAKRRARRRLDEATQQRYRPAGTNMPNCTLAAPISGRLTREKICTFAYRLNGQTGRS